MQLNIGDFGDVRELLCFATALVKSQDPKNVIFAEKTQKFARTGLTYIFSVLNKSEPPAALQEAHDDIKNWFCLRHTTTRFRKEKHEVICACGAISRGPPGAPAPRV